MISPGHNKASLNMRRAKKDSLKSSYDYEPGLSPPGINDLSGSLEKKASGVASAVASPDSDVAFPAFACHFAAGRRNISISRPEAEHGKMLALERAWSVSVGLEQLCRLCTWRVN